MISTLFIARARLRTRTWSFTVLALTIGVVGTVSLAAFAGAQRTEQVFDRLRSATLDDDLQITRFGNHANDDELLERLRRSPFVAAASDTRAMILFPEGYDESTDADFVLIGDPDDRIGVDLDRPLLIAGRRPRSDAVDEVLLGEPAARTLGLAVGDHLRGRALAPATIDCLMAETCGLPNGPDGPNVDLKVVGIGRRPDEIRGSATKAGNYGLVSPEFARRVGPELGAFGWIVNARLGPGEHAHAALERDLLTMLRDIPNAGVGWAERDYVESTKTSLNTLANALLIFGLIAALAGLVALAQMISRELVAADAMHDPLRALGITRAGRATSLVAPLVLPLVVGSVLAAAGAYVASTLMPIGLARTAEPNPGREFVPEIVAGGAIALMLMLLMWAAFVGWRTVAVPALAAPRRTPFVERMVGATRHSAAAGVGVHYAFSPRSGRSRIPVRSALVAVVVAITGVVAVAVVLTSLTALGDTPARFGYAWSARVDLAGDDSSTLRSLEQDARIAAIAWLQSGEIAAKGRLRAYAIDDAKATISPTILRGRAPASDREIAVGDATLRTWHLHVGDIVRAEPATGNAPIDLHIVGTAVIPSIDDDAPGRGAFLTKEGLAPLDRSAHEAAQLILQYAPGVDSSKLEQDLHRDAGLDFNIYSRPAVPGAILNLQRSREVMVWLAAFLAALGALGVVHALVVSTRRRRDEFATLRAIGFLPRQARATVLWQSSAITLVGVAIGVPVGLLVGQQVWTTMIGALGIRDVSTTPWAFLAVTPIAAAVIALFVAWLPARAASRLRLAELLRTD